MTATWPRPSTAWALGRDGGWWAPAYRPGDRPVYQVVRGGQTLAVPVSLRRAEVAGRLLQAWGTILFVVALFVVVAYLYVRRPGPATGGPLVLGIVLAMVRYLTATDPIGRQQLKWLAGGAFVSGTLALVVWFLPELLFGEACRCWPA